MKTHFPRFVSLFISVALGMATPALPIFAQVQPADFTAVVGDGTPNSCTESAFHSAVLAAMANSGTVTFNCGPNPVVISVGNQGIDKAVSIDGGGKVTLSGSRYGTIGGRPIVMPTGERLFSVGSGAALGLFNITLQDATDKGDLGGGCVRIEQGAQFRAGNSVLQRCRADGRPGGAIYSDGYILLIETTVQNSFASQGAGIFVDAHGEAYVRASQVLSNTAGTLGGGVGTVGKLEISQTNVQGNMANDGAGIRNAGNLNMMVVTVVNNRAKYTGGGLYCSAGLCSIERSTFDRNLAEQHGGGLRVYAQASVTLDASTFSANDAASEGGAIFNDGGSLTVYNSTFSANTGASGSFLFNSHANGNADAYFQQVTVVGNHASAQGGAVHHTGGQVAIKGSLFADNDPATCDAGGQPIASGGRNLSSDASCNFTVVTDLGSDRRGVTISLGPLAASSGPTFVHLPLAGSLAIDAISCLGLAPIDQRAILRPQGARCDVGAVEIDSGNTGSLLPRSFMPIVTK